MKKTILVIIIFILFCFGLYKAGIYILESKIENKKNIIYTNVSEIYIKNKDNNLFIKKLNVDEKYLNNDSLNEIINENIKTKQQLSLDYVEQEYYINKGINKLLKDTLLQANEINKVKKNITELNKLIENYNYSVENYNSFVRSFPINLYTIKKYKTEEYFELTYGKDNKNPKTKYDEVPEWMLELEKSKGL